MAVQWQGAVAVLLLIVACVHGVPSAHHINKDIGNMLSSQEAWNALPRGNGMWLYAPHNFGMGTVGPWAQWLDNYNRGANRLMDTVFTYGGDLEMYAYDVDSTLQVYFDSESRDSAEMVAGAEGVKNVIAVIDGDMDGGMSYSPDVTRLSYVQIDKWADRTAKLYCSHDHVSGLHVQLEPFRKPYVSGVMRLVSSLSARLRSDRNGCVNNVHPNGRTVSISITPEDLDPEVFSSLGPNGFVILNGYDLRSDDGALDSTKPNSVDSFGEKLTAAVRLAGEMAREAHSHVMVSLHMTASSLEYESHTTREGDLVDGYPLFDENNVERSYLGRAISVLNAEAREKEWFLGTVVTGFVKSYPSPWMLDTRYSPEAPFAQPGKEAFMAKHL